MNQLLFLGLGTPEILILLFLIIIPTILWVWALIDILKSQFKGGSDKVVWLLVVCFLPLLGFILYFSIGRNQKVS